jgi:hypothetical protein
MSGTAGIWAWHNTGIGSQKTADGPSGVQGEGGTGSVTGKCTLAELAQQCDFTSEPGHRMEATTSGACG